MGGQGMTSALSAMERTMRKAMDDDAASDDNVAKRMKTVTNVVVMSFFTRLLVLVHVISGGRQPQTKIALVSTFPRE
jgi:hypothetical protein